MYPTKNALKRGRFFSSILAYRGYAPVLFCDRCKADRAARTAVRRACGSLRFYSAAEAGSDASADVSADSDSACELSVVCDEVTAEEVVPVEDVSPPTSKP